MTVISAICKSCESDYAYSDIKGKSWEGFGYCSEQCYDREEHLVEEESEGDDDYAVDDD